MNGDVTTVRQNLQILYTRRLIDLLLGKPGDQMSAAAAYSSLNKIEKIAKKSSSDPETQAHREMILWLLDSSLKKN